MCGKSGKDIKQELLETPIDDLMAFNLDMLPSGDIDLSYLQGNVFADIQSQAEIAAYQQPYDPTHFATENEHTRTSSYGSSISSESNSVDGYLSPLSGTKSYGLYSSTYATSNPETPQTPAPPMTPYQWPNQAFFPDNFSPSMPYSPHFYDTPTHHTPTHHTSTHHTATHHTPAEHTPSHHTPSHHTPTHYTQSHYTPLQHQLITQPNPSHNPVQKQAWNAHLKNFIKSNEVDASNSTFQLSSVSKSSLKMRRSRASRSKCPCVKCSSARVNGFPSPINHLCIVKGCIKSYTRPAHLRNHLKTHQHNEDLKCEICQKSFLQSEMMINHMAEHEPDLKLF